MKSMSRARAHHWASSESLALRVERPDRTAETAVGVFWRSTVPLTHGVVAARFGVKNLSMLGGIVLRAHRLGSFLGGWLGGLIYDRMGS